jgi:hypothetical protein
MASRLPRPATPAGLGLVAGLTTGLASEEFAMSEKPKKLSKTARALLIAASARDDHLIRPPQLTTAAARQGVRSLLNAGLAEEVPAVTDNAGYVWRQGDDGSDLMLRATDLGLARIREADDSMPVPDPAERTIMAGADTDRARAPGQPLIGDVPIGEPQAGGDVTHVLPEPVATPAIAKPSNIIQETPPVLVRSIRWTSLRQAPQGLLEVWDASASAEALDEHFTALRAAVTMEGAASPQTDHPRPPRDTKQARVLALLSRPWSAQEGHGGRDHRAQARRSCVW